MRVITSSITATTLLLIAGPAMAVNLHFLGTETGTINGVPVNVVDDMIVDSTNGHRTLVSGPFSPSIIGSVAALDYKGADACWTGIVNYSWNPQPAPYASSSSGNIISKPLRSCCPLSCGFQSLLATSPSSSTRIRPVAWHRSSS